MSTNHPDSVIGGCHGVFSSFEAVAPRREERPLPTWPQIRQKVASMTQDTTTGLNDAIRVNEMLVGLLEAEWMTSIVICLWY
jgi:hypothetical protein